MKGWQMASYPEINGYSALSLADEGLGPVAVQVYMYAVTRLHFHPAELVDALGLKAGEIDDAMGRLLGLKLVQPELGRDDGEMTCVPPESAADLLLAPFEQQAREQRQALGRIRSALQALVPGYEAGVAHRRRIHAVEVVSDLAAVREIIEEAARLCTEQVLTSQPGGGRSAEVLADAIPRDEDMLRRRVVMRSIYQHTARYDAPTIAYVERVAGLGAQVRTLGDNLMRMIVFDHDLGIMEVPDDRYSAVVIREANIVSFMISAFDRAWITAEPFPTSFARREVKLVSEDLRQLIVSLLAEGRDDKSIARRLGMSERTCQRYVRDIMLQLGAKTRFQAGYLIRAARDAVEPAPEAR
jgi:DNA-binding CsgD family transcriptional regulator